MNMNTMDAREPSRPLLRAHPPFPSPSSPRRLRRPIANPSSALTTVSSHSHSHFQQAYINIPLPLLVGAGVTSLSLVLYKPCVEYYQKNKRAILRKQVALKRQASSSLTVLKHIKDEQQYHLQKTKRRLNLFYRFRLAVFIRDLIAKITIFLINRKTIATNPETSASDAAADDSTDLLPKPVQAGSIIENVQLNLDRIRDRAVAQLENERLASDYSVATATTNSAVASLANDSTNSSRRNIDYNNDSRAADVDSNKRNLAINNERYSSFSSLQRRELLSSTFDHRIASERRRYQVIMENEQQKQKNKTIVLENQISSSATASTSTEASEASSRWRNVKFSINSKPNNASGGNANGTGSRKKNLHSELTFWQTMENVNGRAAAIGFLLCLAREIIEPGHPSLFEQVIDVVVPIAQSTPPFLVAVCDRLADLLT